MKPYIDPLDKKPRLTRFFVGAFTNSIARKFNVKIEEGSGWGFVVAEKKLIYGDNLRDLDEEAAIGLILHEVGHLTNTRFDSMTAPHPSSPLGRAKEAGYISIAHMEDIRIDEIMENEYLNSFGYISGARQLGLQKMIKTLEEQNDTWVKYRMELRQHQNTVSAQTGNIPPHIQMSEPAPPTTDIAPINPVREVMILATLIFYGESRNKAVLHYRDQEFIDIATEVVKAFRKSGLAFADSTDDVVEIYEKDIYPLIQDVIPTDSQGQEVPIEGIQSLMQALSDLEEKVEAILEAEKNGNQPGQGKGGGETAYDEWRKPIEKRINASSEKVRRTVKDNRFDRYSGKFRSGKIGKKQLYRSKLGDYRLFQRKIERKNKDYALNLLVDVSGSMSGTMLERAMQGMALLTESFDNAGLDTRVVFFSTGHAVGKEFGQPLSRKLMSQAMRKVWQGGTEITEPIHEAYERLGKHKSGQKICVVITDAEFYDNDKKTIQRLSHGTKDVHCYGIGVGVDVSGTFPNAIKINRPDEIVPLLATIIRRHVKTG